MRPFSHAGIRADPAGERILRLAAEPSARLDAENSERVLEELRAILRREGSLDILVDARHAGALSIDGALPWLRFLRESGPRIQIHVYEMPFALRALLLVAQASAARSIHVHPNEAAARGAVGRVR